MSGAKFTPGPWSVDGPPNNQIVWSSAENRVCFLAHSNGLDDDRDIATGHLIAAAPDMYEALRPFLPAYHAYVAAMRSHTTSGETWTERRFSEGERQDEASEAAFEELAKVTFEHLAAVAAALAKAEGREASNA